jgi:hypothetical protein
MAKLDFTKLYKTYYRAGKKPELLHFEKAQYISVNGQGDPSGKSFADHIQALYSVAYTIKFLHKNMDQDFVVAKLEGLWHFDEEKHKYLTIETAPLLVPRSEWFYTLLIRMPDYVSAEQIENACETVIVKKGIHLASKVNLFEMPAGNAVQMLHVGPFDKEPETLMQVRDFMTAHNLERNGFHHEIYLSDFRKTPSEKLKTILREPVK